MPDVRTLYQQFRVMGIPRGEALSANGHTPLEPDDPLGAALLRQRAASAARIDDGTARLLETQADLDRRKMEVEAQRLELEAASTEAKLQAVRADLRKIAAEQQGGNGNGHDVGLQALLQFMAQNHEQAKADRETLFTLLNEQIEASRAQQASSPEPAPSPSVAEQIQQLVAIRGAMAELFPPPPPPAAGVNPHQLIELRKMELDVEYQRARLAEESRARQIQLAQDERRYLADLEVRQKQVQAEADRNSQMAGLIDRLGPPALAALAQRFVGDGGAGGGGQGGPPAPPPPGDQQLAQLQCPSCGGAFLLRPGATAVACPHCHTYLDLRGAAPASG